MGQIRLISEVAIVITTVWGGAGDAKGGGVNCCFMTPVLGGEGRSRMVEWGKVSEISASGLRRGIEIHRSSLLFQLLVCICGNSIRRNGGPFRKSRGERVVLLGKGESWPLPSSDSGPYPYSRTTLSLN